MAMIKGRKLTMDENKEVLALTDKDITMRLMKDYFAIKRGNDAPRFNTYDRMDIPAGCICEGVPSKTIEDTVGRYIFNMYVLPKSYLKKFGYMDKPLDKKNFGKVESRMSPMILEDEMSVQEFTEYLNRCEWLVMGIAYFLSPTLNYAINVPIPEVIDLKNSLLDKHMADISKGDQNALSYVESTVVDAAKDAIKKDKNEAYEIYECGVGKFNPQYKKMSIMGGIIQNPYTHKLDFMKSNYVDGITPKEFPKFANLTVEGGYARGKKTADGGYNTKKIISAMQTTVLGEPGSDCGTKSFLDITIPEKHADMFYYRYVLDPSSPEADEKGLVMITSSNIGKYTGKPLKMRSPLYCRDDHICSKCAGEMYYKMGITNVGLLAATMGGVMLNINMAKFHDSSIKFNRENIDKYMKKL